jgi:hypothetical protein
MHIDCMFIYTHLKYGMQILSTCNHASLELKLAQGFPEDPSPEPNGANWMPIGDPKKTSTSTSAASGVLTLDQSLFSHFLYGLQFCRFLGYN